MQTATQQALEEWSKILPPDAVLTGASLASYRQNCLSLTRDTAAALRPSTEADVVRVVQIANRYRVPLYTISTGHNWGYGSALPVCGGCVILDLSRMNRILDMDPELGLVTLEPGVTQKQLFDYLDRHGLNFFVPTTGAGPSASIVGNALERGWGLTPDEDHFRAVTSIRAVLPDGTVYRSYMSEFGAAGGVWKWGIGPYLDGLFAQSNFGIVTSMQISLVKRPEHIEVYLFTLKKAADFSKLADGCRNLLTDLRGHIGGIKLLNQRQVELTTGTTKLGMNLAADFAWMGFGVIRCKRSMIRSIRREIGRELAPIVSRLVFVNERRLKLMRMAQAFIPGTKVLKEQVDRMAQLFDIVNGIPNGLELKLVYRHVPVPDMPSLDPARDGVGIIWYAPVLPMKTSLMIRMIDMIEKTLHEHGFEQAVSLTTIHEKCAIGVIPIIFRRPDEQEKAHECFRDLWRRGNELGCHPYRINVGAMTSMTGGQDSTYWNLARDLKAAIDPQNILSPGRYSPLIADSAEAEVDSLSQTPPAERVA